MRTDQRYTRTRVLLTDEAVPRLSSGGIALCHICQRNVYFAGGFLDLLLRRLEQGISTARPKGCCPRCGGTKFYMITRRALQRCTSCKFEYSPSARRSQKSGKKPQDWYDRVRALKDAGHNPHQISKLMGCHDAKPIYDFFKREALAETTASGFGTHG